MLGVTGARVQRLAAKVSKEDNGSATVLRRPMVAECAWGRQTKACLVTKVTVQVSERSHFTARVF